MIKQDKYKDYTLDYTRHKYIDYELYILYIIYVYYIIHIVYIIMIIHYTRQVHRLYKTHDKIIINSERHEGSFKIIILLTGLSVILCMKHYCD